MLVKNIEDRATASELLQHPFICKSSQPSAIVPIIQEIAQSKIN